MSKTEKNTPQTAGISTSHTSFLADVYDTIEYLTMPVHHNIKAALDSMQLLKLHPVQYESAKNGYMTHVPDHNVIKTPNPSSILSIVWYDPQLIIQHTRMSAAEFSIIVSELEPYLMQPYDVDSSLSSSSSSSSSSHYRSLDVFDQVLLWCYFSDTNYAESLSLLFNISIRSIYNIADHVTRAITLRYMYEIEWPDQEERIALHGLFSVYPLAIALLDGTHCRIVVPSDKQQEDNTFSGYKNYHSQNLLVYTDALGFIRLIEGPFAGHSNDRSVFKESVIYKNPSRFLGDSERIVLTFSEDITLEGERIIADGGFFGSGPVLCPVKYDMAQTEEKKAETPEEKQQISDYIAAYNEELTLNRSAVENSIHIIKNRAQSLLGAYTRSRECQTDLFYAAARLVNRIRRLRYDNQIAMNKLAQM